MDFFEELIDEISDFGEDFAELFGKRPKRQIREREVTINGVATRVRPAYIFAERLDNLLKVVFGIAIVSSAVTSTFLGFETLSGLLDILITNLLGRFIMLLIGFSYFITAFWKLLHLNSKS